MFNLPLKGRPTTSESLWLKGRLYTFVSLLKGGPLKDATYIGMANCLL